MPVVRYRVIVTGRVQGVWYRRSCQEAAAAAGVAGWVRNRDDGSVEAVLEGGADAVEPVLAWMRSGPPRALVTELRCTAEEPRAEQGFAVR